jgi:hypothetical protein
MADSQGEEGGAKKALYCDWLETEHGYIFRSWHAAWNSILAHYPSRPRPMAYGRQITTVGPCVGRGYHRTVRQAGTRVASIVQCPCVSREGHTSERLKVVF